MAFCATDKPVVGRRDMTAGLCYLETFKAEARFVITCLFAKRSG